MNLAPIAIWILKKELKDEGYRRSWEANIAMCMVDSFISLKNKDIREAANDGAKRFIDLLLR